MIKKFFINLVLQANVSSDPPLSGRSPTKNEYLQTFV